MNKQLHSTFFKKQKKVESLINFRKDWVIKLVADMLLLMGMIVVISSSYSATKIYSLKYNHYAVKHFCFCLLSLFAMRFFSKQKKNLEMFGKLIWYGSIILLIVVLFVNNSIKGASRWISLFGFSLQPSEFAKIGIMLEGAKYVHNDWKNFALTYLVPMSLILIQPDLGNTFLIASVGLAQIITKNFEIKYLGAGFISLCMLFFVAYFSFSHVQKRVDIFLNPHADIYGAGYQRSKSLLAIQNGGMCGLGFGKGVIKDVLPDAHTDFVFSVIIEEFGLLGGLFVIMLFMILGIRVLSLLAKDEKTYMIQYTFIISILAQAWLNIASTLSLIPTKGLPMPLVSYGGSGLLMQGICFGILLATCIPKGVFNKD